ncbi:MAG: coenzyme F420-0:L-glutamate ligase [Patescibacteria group bacterium]|nr:coenzyme F420-0:L-glutamate ligase [Patescibacteria group bacterium]
MRIKAIKTRIFKPREKLLLFIASYLPKIKDKTILVVTSKIVALSQGRLVDKVDEKTKMRIIRQESDFVLPTKYVCLTVKDGQVMANAGVDESNGNGRLILLPKDSFKAAAKIRSHFKKKYRLKNLGVIITDSRCLPLRSGITGMAIGYAGFQGLKSYARGGQDIFGRLFEYSRVDVADSLATAAVLLMGEGDERQPLAVITGAPVAFCKKTDWQELKIDIREDMYGPMFKALK